LFDTCITHAWSGGDFLYDQFEAFCIFIYGVYVQLNLSYLIQQLGSIQLNLSYSILQERSSYFINLINLQNKISQVSRIILATDADGPGQALAEELARRLGKERYLLFCLYFFLIQVIIPILMNNLNFRVIFRCWRVKWPMKNDVETFKDANEV
jgi:Toprim domain